MARPMKHRFIEKRPKINKFSPRGRRGRPDYIILNLEEYEAIRLADFRGLKQMEASKLMHVSRQTFGRILTKAHRNLADALVNGKIIKINSTSINLKNKSQSTVS